MRDAEKDYKVLEEATDVGVSLLNKDTEEGL